MPVFTFEKRDIQLLRLFLKAYLLRLIRMQSKMQGTMFTLKEMNESVSVDLVYNARSPMQGSLLILMNDCLGRFLIDSVNVPKKNRKPK